MHDKSHSVLAIVTPNPDTVAETYVRQHIRLIHPGKTVVVYFSGEGRSVEDIPALKLDPPAEHSVIRKVNGMFNLIRHGYSGTVRGEQRRRLMEFFIKHKVSCVMAEFGQTGCQVKAACKNLNLPLYVFFHGQDAGVGCRTLKRKYSYWRMGAYATKVFAPSRCFSSHVIAAGMPAKKIHVAPHGLDIDRFTPALEKDSKLLLAVGRMVEKKAPHLTVRAFAKVLKQIPDIRLEMIGDGDLLEQTKAEAKQLGIEQQVVFHGAQDHRFVLDRLKKAAVFLQHSVTAANGDTESFGISLIEAMACEVPVVTTRHNGFVETVSDGETGFLVEEGDVDAMAERAASLLTDEALHSRMARASRERVLDHFREEKQCGLLARLMNI